MPNAATRDEPHDLEQLLDRLSEAADASDDKLTLRAAVDAVGRRSFGPLLLLCGLIAASPLSGIPGLPTTVAVLVIVVGAQMLIGRKNFWLPQWVLDRKISTSKYCKALEFVRPAARFVDRLLRPRLTVLTRGVGTYVIAVICILIALTMPPLEILPFLATLAGIALTAFGLAVIAEDGLLFIIALLVTVGGSVVSVTQLLGS
jgi:hypothetical protein